MRATIQKKSRYRLINTQFDENLEAKEFFNLQMFHIGDERDSFCVKRNLVNVYHTLLSEQTTQQTDFCKRA